MAGMPKELGDDSTIHRTFQRWVQLGVLERIWSVLVKECEELGGVEWEWQAVDCAMGKARGPKHLTIFARIHQPNHREAVFWLGIVHGVTAHYQAGPAPTGLASAALAYPPWRIFPSIPLSRSAGKPTMFRASNGLPPMA